MDPQKLQRARTIVTPLAHMQAGHDAWLQAPWIIARPITTWKMLRQGIKKSQSSFVVTRGIDRNKGRESPGDRFEQQESGGSDNYIWIIDLAAPIISTESNRVLLIGGSDWFFNSITAKVNAMGRWGGFLAGSLGIDPETLGRKETLGQDEIEIPIEYYDTDETGAYAVLMDPTVPMLTKVTTIWWVYFPMVTDFILENFKPLPLTDVQRNYINNTLKGKVTPEQQQVSSGIGILSPAYTIKDNLPKQMQKRISVACVASNSPPVTLAAITDAFQTGSLDIVNLPGQALEMIGRGVAINSNFDYDFRVTTAELAGEDEVKTHYGLSGWVTALFAQARMVYKSFHATTIEFAIAVCSLSKDTMTKMTEVWQNEWGAVNSLKNDLVDRVYTGCRQSLPTAQRVAHFPRMCMIGIYYYKDCLTDPTEQAAMDAYETKGIQQHISPSADIQACQAIAELLPKVAIQTSVQLCSKLPPEGAERVLSRLSPAQKEDVLYYCLQKADPGEWALGEKTKRQNQERVRLIQSVKQQMSKDMTETVNRMRQQALNLDNDEQRRIRFAEILEMENQFTAAEGRLLSLEDIVPHASTAALDEVRDRVLVEVSTMWDILKGNTVGTTHEVYQAKAHEKEQARQQRIIQDQRVRDELVRKAERRYREDIRDEEPQDGEGEGEDGEN